MLTTAGYASGIALIALGMDAILIAQWATYDKRIASPAYPGPQDEEAGVSPTERTSLLASRHNSDH